MFKNLIGLNGVCVLANLYSEQAEHFDFSYKLLDDMCIESLVALVITNQRQKLDLSHNYM